MIIAVQPITFFSLLAVLAGNVFNVEILILRALLDIQISQQQYAWISERFYHSTSHDWLPESVCGVIGAARCIVTS